MHTSTYCCVSAFSTMNMVKNKYRSTLTNEHYISASAWPSHLLCLNLKHTKGVTFHTNKARLHHLLCIVQTFLLELCFWILTVTVPDPDLNGNLASGPFVFLIEYPCSTGCAQCLLVLALALTDFIYHSGVQGKTPTVFSSVGGDATLLCSNVVYPNCSSTTWNSISSEPTA